jgi:hypothetical protein
LGGDGALGFFVVGLALVHGGYPFSVFSLVIHRSLKGNKLGVCGWVSYLLTTGVKT